jgi:WD40 repeat protein
VAFSPVRNLLAATSGRKTVAFYDLDTGQEFTALRMPEQEAWFVHDLSFSPDGSRLLVYAQGPNQATGDAVWVIHADSVKIESRHRTFLGPSQFHGAARLSPDNRRLYLAHSDPGNYRYSIRCIDLANGEERWRTEPNPDYGLTALAISPDGAVLASGSGFEDPTIRIWDARTGKLLFRLEGHTGWVCKLAFTADGRRLLSAAADQTIRVWEVKSWTETRVLRGHSDEVHAVAISAKAGLIASAGKDGNLMLWREDEKPGKDGYLALPDTFRNVATILLGQSRLLLGSSGGTNSLLDLKENATPVVLPGLMPPARQLGSFGTNTLCYWDGTNQILIGQLRETNFVKRSGFELKTGAVPSAFAINVERELIAWTEASAETAIYVANLKTPGRWTELKSDLPGARDLLLSAEGAYLAASTSSRVRVWQLETGRIVASIDERVAQVVFAAGDRVLVASVLQGRDHEIRFYDLSNPDSAPRTFPGKDRSRSLAVSPDGRLVAASSDAGYWMLFDPAKSELIASVRGHLNAAFCVAFSPDGRRLISSGGGREAIKIWDVDTQQELLTLPGAGSFLSLASWSPDGNEILASQPPQVWRAPSWEEIAAAEAKERPESKQP